MYREIDSELILNRCLSEFEQLTANIRSIFKKVLTCSSDKQDVYCHICTMHGKPARLFFQTQIPLIKSHPLS